MEFNPQSQGLRPCSQKLSTHQARSAPFSAYTRLGSPHKHRPAETSGLGLTHVCWVGTRRRSEIVAGPALIGYTDCSRTVNLVSNALRACLVELYGLCTKRAMVAEGRVAAATPQSQTYELIKSRLLACVTKLGLERGVRI